MNKYEISEQLASHHNQFIDLLRSLHEQDYIFAPHGKWNAAKQLDHIIKSVTPVNMALGIPKIFLKWKFGIANRPSKTYEELVAKYNVRLQEGGKASGQFIAEDSSFEQREAQLIQLNALIKKLNSKVLRYTEPNLDLYILPHPLLGKLTLREMLYFTSYHVAHHSQLVLDGLKQKEQE